MPEAQHELPDARRRATAATSGGQHAGGKATHAGALVRCTSARTATEDGARARRGTAAESIASSSRGRGSGTGTTDDDPRRALREHDDAIGEPDGLVDVVRHEQRGARALLERRLEPGLRIEPRLRVERRERLVEREHRTLGEQRAHERDALAHAAGERVRVVLGERLRARGARAARGRQHARRTRAAGELGREQDVAEHAAPLEQEVALQHQGDRARAAGGIAARPRATRPAVGASTPAAMASSVDLPQPDGPTSATVSPAASERSMPASTGPVPG